MSILSNSDIKDCIESNRKNSIKWKNKQEFILCLECDRDTEPKNISMMYKCDNVDAYTLYCVCVKCIKTHISNLNTKRNHNKIEAIKKENRNQNAIKKAIGSSNTFAIMGDPNFNADRAK